MELHEALGEISAIRRQLARGERFRGYRAAPVALSGVSAFVAGAGQRSGCRIRRPNWTAIWRFGCPWPC